MNGRQTIGVRRERGVVVSARASLALVAIASCAGVLMPALGVWAQGPRGAGAAPGGGGGASGAAARAPIDTQVVAGQVEQIDGLVRAIQELPWGVHLVMIAAMAGGIVLWLFGRSVIRPTTAIVGAAIGAGIGFVLIPALAPASGVSPYLGLFAGLVVGLIAGAVLHRFATAAMFGAVLGVSSATLAAGLIALLGPGGLGGGSIVPAASVSVVETDVDVGQAPTIALGELATELATDQGSDQGTGLGGEEQPLRPKPGTKPAPTRRSTDEWLILPAERPEPSAAPSTEPAKRPPLPTVTNSNASSKSTPASSASAASGTGTNAAGAKALANGRPSTSAGNATGGARRSESPKDLDATSIKARQLYDQLRATFDQHWEATPQPQRMWIIGSAVLGAGAGVLAGLMMPLWAAAGVTSLVGAGVWVPSGVWLAHAFFLPGRELLGWSLAAWAIVWVVVALIGMAVQTQGLLPSPAGGGGKKGKRRKADDEE